MKKTDVIKFIEILKETYPDATCSLDFETPFQMVVAVMLSAQCTDERVNKTTPALFKRCKTIQDFADIDIKELEEIIHPCGFYKNKAKNIKLCAKQVLENFGGVVPDNMNDLQSLAGVGRKSANVVMLEAFNKICLKFSQMNIWKILIIYLFGMVGILVLLENQNVIYAV